MASRPKPHLATSAPTPAHRPRPGWAHHHPEELWRCVAETIRRAVAQVADPGRIAGIAAASMGESGVPRDASGAPTGEIIAWFDSRTHAQAEWLERTLGRDRVYERTGLFPKPIFGLCKMRWFKERAPGAYARTAAWLNVADYIAFRLSGKKATDYSLASRTLAFNIHRREWDREILGESGISPDLFAPALPGGADLGPVLPGAARETGLPETARVAAGGHDHVCGALAAGAVEPGALLNSIGTAEAVFLPLRRPSLTPELNAQGHTTGAHVASDRYYILGGIYTSGASVEWLREVLGETTAQRPRLARRLPRPHGRRYAGRPLPGPARRPSLRIPVLPRSPRRPSWNRPAGTDRRYRRRRPQPAAYPDQGRRSEPLTAYPEPLSSNHPAIHPAGPHRISTWPFRTEKDRRHQAAHPGRPPGGTRRSIQKKWGFEKATTRYEDALRDTEIDAVIVASPSELHHEQTAKALEAGKDVLVEIPLALSHKGARDLAGLVRKTGRKLMVAHTRRFRQIGRFVRDFIASGRAGQVYQHHSHEFWLRHENVGWIGYRRSWVDDVLFHHGCHMVDYSLWTVGAPVRRVRGELSPLHPKTGASMDVSMLIRYTNETIATVSLSYNAPQGISGNRFICENGTLAATGNRVTLNREVLFESDTDLQDHVLAQNTEFVAALRENRQPACNAEHGLAALTLLQQVYDQMVILEGEEKYRRMWGL